MELLFERFLSEERGEWPDIDLDLPSGDRRESVIQHVYEKYGMHGAAPEGPRVGMTANVITYRGKSAAREVGKTLGFEPQQIDRLAKVMNNFEFVDASDTLPRQLASVGLDMNADHVRHFARLWNELQDLPRHLGQHSGGMVISQGRLDAVVPLENATMPGRVVVQWDKDDCADLGIVKVDLLGLGMMAALQDALALINRRDSNAAIESRIPNPEPRVDLAHLPANDPDVYRMLQQADTIGVFQVESRAQMATLPRLRPTTFYDLVVEVAIIRPGPIVGQMVHPYLNRRAGREAVSYPHPSLEPILKRTLGVPLFQEQLLRIAMVAAGFTGGQAEDLRRAMGFKRSEKRMKAIEAQLREGMARNGITGDAAEGIITAITSFALYGFPESHAASFALLAYASAYLKAHFPAAFYTALLNNQPMGFYHPSTLVKDAQRRGIRFHPIDVQVSAWDCTVEADGGIRLGLRYVAGLRQEAGKVIAASHGARGFSRAYREDACPKCGCDDPSMLEPVMGTRWFCNTCSHDWDRSDSRSANRLRQGFGVSAAASAKAEAVALHHDQPRFASLDDLVARTGLRRNEVVTLADVGALNSFGYDRRSALWQAERAVRPSGELFEERTDEEWSSGSNEWGPAAIPSEGLRSLSEVSAIERAGGGAPAPVEKSDGDDSCPLRPMTEVERIVADYAGTGLTIGRHPMALKRDELSMRGILPARDLYQTRQSRRVRVAGMVITRQRPGTAKGFVFLTLEDETGIANIIVRPDLFVQDRLTVIEEPFLIVDGILQQQDGVTSVRAEQIYGLRGLDVDFDAHDFY
jgi:error-prone DNA polymerase